MTEQQQPTGLDSTTLEQCQALTASFYEAMRGLVEQMKSQPRAKGKRLIMNTYFKAKAIAQIHRIPTPPLREKPETSGLFTKNIPGKSVSTAAPPVTAPPVMAPEVVYDADPAWQDLEEIKDYQRKNRKAKG